MAAITIRTFLYGFTIFTLLIMGGLFIIYEFANEKPSFITSDDFKAFNDSFNQFDELNATYSSLSDSIAGTNEDWGLFGVLNSLIKTAWGTLKSIFTTLGFVTDAGTGLTTVFGLPSFIPTLLMGLLILLIVFSIFSLIFQGET